VTETTVVSDMRIAFAGEALIDFTTAGSLAFQGREGGAIANSAIAAARLGQRAGLLTALSTDLFGERLLAHLQGNAVDTRLLTRDAAASALAFVQRDGEVNRYAFHIAGSAGTRWQAGPQLPESCRWLYFGSIALLYEPAASHIVALARAQRGQRVVLFDPNLRPSLITDLANFRQRCAGWMRDCDILKLSEEDLALLAPGIDAAHAVADFLALGPAAVVLTRGSAGATLYRSGDEPLSVAPPPVQLADSIGAGDTFGAALVVALLEHGVERPLQLAGIGREDWAEVLRFAATAAALNCTREGADPPNRSELDAALATRAGGRLVA
jgi:fructokinase